MNKNKNLGKCASPKGNIFYRLGSKLSQRTKGGPRRSDQDKNGSEYQKGKNPTNKFELTGILKL